MNLNVPDQASAEAACRTLNRIFPTLSICAIAQTKSARSSWSLGQILGPTYDACCTEHRMSLLVPFEYSSLRLVGAPLQRHCLLRANSHPWLCSRINGLCTLATRFRPTEQSSDHRLPRSPCPRRSESSLDPRGEVGNMQVLLRRRRASNLPFFADCIDYRA